MVFINVFFSRLAEYGTDRLGSILVILIFLVLLLLINNNAKNFKSEQKELIIFLFIIGSILISMKSFYLIYSSLIFFLIYYKHLNENLFQIISSKFFIIITIFILSIFFYNFINSGCLLFPAKFTCYEYVDWAIPKKEVEDVKIWYELWSKGGASPNFIVDDRKII